MADREDILKSGRRTVKRVVGLDSSSSQFVSDRTCGNEKESAGAFNFTSECLMIEKRGSAGSDLIATVDCHTKICMRRRYELVAKER